MSDVILLNADYSFLTTTNWKKAIKLVEKGKVEVIKTGEKLIKNFEKTIEFAIPKIIKLIKFARVIYRREVPLTKKNLFIRDRYTCLYCGVKVHDNPTKDHVVPKSKGGNNSWTNCVTSCRKCNTKKGNKTPKEAKMYLKHQPVKPTIAEFMQIKSKMLGVSEVIDDLFKSK